LPRDQVDRMTALLDHQTRGLEAQILHGLGRRYNVGQTAA
jgi:hypothetical protein